MRLRFRALLAIFLFVSLFHTDILLSDIQKIEIRELKLEECLLPKKHPLSKQLKDLFTQPNLFNSPRFLRQAGFRVSCRNRKDKVIVARHPDIPNYIIKKFRNCVPQQDQLANYLKRVNGARHLRKFIDLNHLNHIIVPQKWIYRLPKQFSDPETHDYTYILIAEEIDICNKKSTIEKYHTISFDVLTDLCNVVHYFKGLDSMLNNLPFTRNDKIAFIDTEKWDEWNRDWSLQQIMPHMSEDRQEYAKSLLEKFSLDQSHSSEN